MWGKKAFYGCDEVSVFKSKVFPLDCAFQLYIYCFSPFRWIRWFEMMRVGYIYPPDSDNIHSRSGSGSLVFPEDKSCYKECSSTFHNGSFSPLHAGSMQGFFWYLPCKLGWAVRGKLTEAWGRHNYCLPPPLGVFNSQFSILSLQQFVNYRWDFFFFSPYPDTGFHGDLYSWVSAVLGVGFVLSSSLMDLRRVVDIFIVIPPFFYL